jgi:hypothetical protein
MFCFSWTSSHQSSSAYLAKQKSTVPSSLIQVKDGGLKKVLEAQEITCAKGINYIVKYLFSFASWEMLKSDPYTDFLRS